jgi:glycosyltransferase involved in cell wall biosynthesis
MHLIRKAEFMLQLRIVRIIPTFNARGNIGGLIDQRQAVFRSLKHEMLILVVDDNSTDGTGDVVREYQKRSPGATPQVHQFIGIIPATLVKYFLNSCWTLRDSTRRTAL